MDYENGLENVTSFTDEINKRQKSLFGDYSCNTAIVVGLGGIGSWLALDLALIGIGTLIIFDDDVIEASNLNRTLFKLSQIGEQKTKAVRDLIMERRKDTIVITCNERFSAEHLSKYNDTDYLFDCSDTTRLKDDLGQVSTVNSDVKVPKYVKLGYDGYEGTLSMNDFNTGLWGEDSPYTITPSFFGTPQILSAFAVIEMVMKQKTVSRTVNMNVKKIINLLDASGTMKN